MRWHCMSKALRFLQITAKNQGCPFLTVFLAIKTSSHNISITLLQISLKLDEHRGRYWRKKLRWTILEEQFPVPRYIAASKISNSVISLLWQLRCRCNPDHNKFSSLSNTTVVAIFPNVCLWRRSLCSNLGGIDSEKLYRATLIVKFWRISLKVYSKRRSWDNWRQRTYLASLPEPDCQNNVSTMFLLLPVFFQISLVQW